MHQVSAPADNNPLESGIMRWPSCRGIVLLVFIPYHGSTLQRGWLVSAARVSMQLYFSLCSKQLHVRGIHLQKVFFNFGTVLKDLERHCS